MKNLALIVKQEMAAAMHSRDIAHINPARGKGELLGGRAEYPLRESLSESYVDELDAWFPAA